MSVCCVFTAVGLDQIRHHCDIQHQYKDEKIQIHFSSMKDFLSWKEAEEKASKQAFIKKTGEKRQKNESVRYYYVCKRSGNFHSESTGKRALKSQGSCKIGGLCLASMAVLMHGDSVEVTYHKNHVAHSNDIAHISLTETERAAIADKLATGVTMQKILDDVRDSISGELTRLHLVTRHDLRNIKMLYNLHNQERCHSNDKVSVTLWVEKMQAEHPTESPVLYFKQQGDADKEGLMADSDFVLAIMLPAQYQILTQFGIEKVCIDSTRGTTAYDFQLTTMLTIDEYGSGFPCAYCLSTRIDYVTMETFFTAVKQRLGSISSKVFMSDDASAYYNAWKKVMGVPERRLLCTWHVDKNWRENVRKKIQDKFSQGLIYKTLRMLLETQDEDEFHDLLQAFRVILSQPEYYQFLEYIEKNYFSRPEMWAYCYRKNAGLNTNMHLESFHKVLKYCYLDGRVDDCVSALLKLTNDKLFDRLIKLCKSHVTQKISIIHARHRTAKTINLETIQKAEENRWKISSQSTAGVSYMVEKLEGCNDSDCSLHCSDCKICMHEYSCTCTDFVIGFNMCKHIHAVMIKETHVLQAGNAPAITAKVVLPKVSADVENVFQSIQNFNTAVRPANSVTNDVINKLKVASGLITGNKITENHIQVFG